MNPDPKDLLVKLIKCKSVTPNDNGALSVIEDVLNANMAAVNTNNDALELVNSLNNNVVDRLEK